MADFVVLDAEAVSALASPRERTVAARRAQAVLAEAGRRNVLVRIPAAVLTEVYRGGPRRDAAVDRVLGRGNRVLALDRATARLAGQLMGRDGLDSRHVVDATVVATAIRLGGAVIVTADPDDMRSLARRHGNVAVQRLR